MMGGCPGGFLLRQGAGRVQGVGPVPGICLPVSHMKSSACLPLREECNCKNVSSRREVWDVEGIVKKCLVECRILLNGRALHGMNQKA